jgi:hypothetical protein
MHLAAPSLLTGRQETRRQRIMMAGPGGMGQAEVAVQRLNGSGGGGANGSGSSGSSGGSSGSGRASRGGGNGGGFLRAAFGAVAAALRDDSPSPSASEDEAYQQAKQQGRGSGQQSADRLQCALMSMRLPVDKLARSVLESLAADARAQAVAT